MDRDLFNQIARMIAEHGFDAVEDAYEAAAAEALEDDATFGETGA